MLEPALLLEYGWVLVVLVVLEGLLAQIMPWYSRLWLNICLRRSVKRPYFMV